MAGSKIYVCSGAVLRCSMGTSNGSLVATPKNVSLCSHEHANIGDHISMANIRPFGRCRSLGFPATAAATAAHHGHLTPMPCVPGTPAPWSAVNPDVIVTGRPALLNTAKLNCVFGGTITIVNPGQALEYTGASEIEIVSRDVVIQEMFWTDDDDEAESDLASADLSLAPTLCLQTSLSEGDQLIVDIGGRSFPTKVGKGGVAKVKNVDAWEVDLDAPVMRKGDKKKTPSAPAKKPSEPKKSAPSKPAPKKPADPAPKKPVNPQEVNTAKVPEPSATTTWGDPVASPRIRRNSPSNLYGKVRRGADGKPRNHQGFDYYAPEGTSVMSVADGIVEFTQTGHASYGNNVAIKHRRGNGYVYSFYAHLSRFASGIRKGASVRKGEEIGKAGTTGNARGMTGPDQHLHFECRTSAQHQIGLGGKENPNNIVATKFTPQSLGAASSGNSGKSTSPAKKSKPKTGGSSKPADKSKPKDIPWYARDFTGGDVK